MWYSSANKKIVLVLMHYIFRYKAYYFYQFYMYHITPIIFNNAVAFVTTLLTIFLTDNYYTFFQFVAFLTDYNIQQKNELMVLGSRSRSSKLETTSKPTYLITSHRYWPFRFSFTSNDFKNLFVNHAYVDL